MKARLLRSAMLLCGSLYAALIAVDLSADLYYAKAGRLGADKSTRSEAIQMTQTAVVLNPFRSETHQLLYYLLNEKYTKEIDRPWLERKKILDLAGIHIRRAVCLEPTKASYHAAYAVWLKKKGGMLKSSGRGIIEGELKKASDLLPLLGTYRDAYDRSRSQYKI